MRTFIAIELPKHIKDALGSLQQELKACGADVKWVDPDNIHLTLKFLGEINEDKLAKVIRILFDIAEDNHAYSVRLASLGALPKPNFPRVICVGIDKGQIETKKVAKGIEEKLEKIGIPRENRAFVSHITIGRMKSPSNRERLVQELQKKTGYFKGRNMEFMVERITLFKSTLSPKGPIYETLEAASLKTT